MSTPNTQTQRLVHSFPRPKQDETEDVTLNRALSILSLIKDIGLVLAPEVQKWDFQQAMPNALPLRILQRRLCFTDLSADDLSPHSKIFGPLALFFDSTKLRNTGAMPVIYMPQGISEPISLIGALCVNGIQHTKHVLGQLQELKNYATLETASSRFGKPVAHDYNLHLQNTNAAGETITSHSVPAEYVRQVLSHIEFNNIPFDHSIGFLSILLSMFCPTDNNHSNEPLGYYRQREWRLIAGDIMLNGRPLGRELLDTEKQNLVAIDPAFWNHELTVDKTLIPRKDLALVYEPTPGWRALDIVESIYAPRKALRRIREIIGDEIPVYESSAAD